MSTLLTVLVLFAGAWAWHAARRRRRAPRVPARGRTRLRSLVLVILFIGLNAVVTAPPAAAAGCEAPNPERPGSGMVGAIDPPATHGEDGSAYLDYSYAGAVWHTYETDCNGGLSGLSDPDTTIDTWAGNQLFNVGKNIVGATNSLHYTVLEGGLLNPIYDAVKSGAEKVYNNIYAQLFGVVALLLAIMMFRNIWRGDLSSVSKRALFALAGVWLAASSLAILRYFDPIDNAIVQTTTDIQAGFVDSSEDRIVREVLPTDLHNHVVYQNWLRGEFGSPDSPQAKEFGRPLLDAQAFTWTQIRNGDDADQAVVDEKKAAYKEIATQLGPATGYFTGEDGSRTGAGFLAFLQSLAYSLFQLFAKAAVLLAQVLVRLFTLTAPLIGLVALLHHDILRRVGKVVGAVAFNLLVLSVLAGVHALLLRAIFDASSSLSMLTQMVMAGLVTILLFLVGRPARRLWQMVEMSVSMAGAAVPSPSSGLFSRFRKRSNEPTPQDEFWKSVRDDDEAAGGWEARGHRGATGGGPHYRPEATVLASSQRLDGSASGAHPAAAWPGSARPGLPGGGRAALPAAGGAAAAAYSGYVPSRSPSDYVQAPSSAAAVSGPSRRVDTAPVADRGWDRGDDSDPLVVPSRMASTGAVRESAHASPGQPIPPQRSNPAPEPRRAESEMVAGKPVFVLYRPSRGFEVRDDLRDTDHVVGRR
ncbi:magnesium transporter [Qaidamihabitans albus]|uniref:magnesium transporter n=1 Tax=Qaidamihabitans albus TaxID=2795733 RepID=UPI0018F1343A|nr:magnesium transporter [Qaidamihabitans albus]